MDRRSIPERHKYLKCEAASVQKNPKGFALGGSLSAATWLSSARRLVFGGLGAKRLARNSTVIIARTGAKKSQQG